MKQNLLIGIVLFFSVLSGFASWFVTDAIWSGDYADLEQEYSDYREQVATANNEILTKHKAELESMQAALAEVDDKHFRELMNVQDNIDVMLDGVGTGHNGLYVRAETNCGDQASTKDSTASSLDDGKALVRLDNEDARALFSIAGYGDGTAVILSGLQDYVRNVCLGRND